MSFSGTPNPPASGPQVTALRISDHPGADNREHHRDLVPEPPDVAQRRETGRHPGRRGVHAHEAGHLRRMAQHHDERDRAAPVVGDKLHGVDAQVIENGGQVLGHLVLGVAGPGRRAPAGTAQIGAQHPVTVGSQRSYQVMPLPPVLREAVHQHHRRTIGRPGVGDMDRDAGSEIYVPVFDTVEGGHFGHAPETRPGTARHTARSGNADRPPATRTFQETSGHFPTGRADDHPDSRLQRRAPVR